MESGSICKGYIEQDIYYMNTKVSIYREVMSDEQVTQTKPRIYKET